MVRWLFRPLRRGCWQRRSGTGLLSQQGSTRPHRRRWSPPGASPPSRQRPLLRGYAQECVVAKPRRNVPSWSWPSTILISTLAVSLPWRRRWRIWRRESRCWRLVAALSPPEAHRATTAATRRWQSWCIAPLPECWPASRAQPALVGSAHQTQPALVGSAHQTQPALVGSAHRAQPALVGSAHQTQPSALASPTACSLPVLRGGQRRSGRHRCRCWW